MTDFEKLLDDVVQGKISLAPLRDWLEQALRQPGCDLGALSASIENAQRAGLSQPVAMVLRKQIETLQNPSNMAPHDKEQDQITATITTT